MAEQQPEIDTGDAKPIALEEPETVAAVTQPVTDAPKVTPTAKPKGGGWLGVVLGGVIAAGAGYGVAQFVPNGWPIQDTSALQAALDAQNQQILTLQQELATLAARPVAEDMTGQLAALQFAQDQALAQIKALEDRPVVAGTDPAIAQEIAALKQQIAQLPTTAAPDTAAAEALLQEAQAAAEKIRAEAEAGAKLSEQRAALGRVQAALDSGAPFGSALASLGEVPAELQVYADSGVPSIAALQDSFPAAARAALDAAIRNNMGESWTERTLSFLRTQTGARSLTPSDGADPDAVLSRAEAALAAHDLTAVLVELDSLPAESQAAMAYWRGLAEQRQTAIKAVADLAAAMEG